jgi:hypothetical protein
MGEWLTELASWAWARHHNVLSWYVRPLFLLPFCWFAWRRSVVGMAATLLALATSMAWFPVPAHPDPAVIQFLAVERDYLLGPWSVAKVAMSLTVPLTFGALAAALWRRSIGWALVVVNAACLFKIGWSYWFDTDGRGADAFVVPALVGLAVVDAGLIAAARHRRAATAPRTAGPRPATAGAPPPAP